MSRRAPPRRLAAALAALLLAATAARAELRESSDTAFVVDVRLDAEVPVERLWQALTQLPQWWNDQHTWSGKAANMTLDLQAGGCWCERWGEGQSVLHGVVVWMRPGRLLRLDSSLGPLQERAVRGVLTFETLVVDGRTQSRWTYSVSGPASAGLAKLAPLVDQVMSEQARRLVKFAQTGSAQ